MQTTRLLLVDDEPLTRCDLRPALDACAPQVEVIAQARSAAEALRLAGRHAPDVVLADLHLQGNQRSGLDFVAALTRRHPALPVLMLTSPGDETLLLPLWEAGAAGFITREGAPADALLPALAAVREGATHHPPDLQQQLRQRLRQAALTERETMIGDLIASGLTSPEIADRLGITPGTVDTHRRTVARKLGVNGRQLPRWCLERLRQHADDPAPHPQEPRP